MNLAVRTGSPVRVTSTTSTIPRPVDTSTRRPARVATISYVREPSSAATTISTRSPLMARAYRGASLRLVQRLAAVLLATGAAAGGAVVVADDGHDGSAPRPPARVRTPATQALPPANAPVPRTPS